MNDQQKQHDISPIALLAAVLFGATETMTIPRKVDDSDEIVEEEIPVLNVEREENALVCVLPLERVLHFATTIYDFRFAAANGVATITIERRAEHPRLYQPNGQRAVVMSPQIERILERMK